MNSEQNEDPKPEREIRQTDTPIQHFTDPPGGAPLNSPEVLARPRRGRPSASGALYKDEPPKKER